MSDVTDQLDQLAAGQVDLDAVVSDFGSRQWPQPDPQPTSDPFQAEDMDPEPDPEGSFSEVAGYYARGKINDEQYAALAEAAAGAMK